MTSTTRPTEIATYRAGTEQLAIVTGIVRLDNCEQFKNRMLGLMHADTKTYYAHTLDVQDLDSAGLGALVGLHITCKRRGVQFVVLSPSANQMRLFEFTKLNTVLKIVAGSEAETARDRLKRPEFEIFTEG